jgi:antitoxin ParD1/3/4
MDADSSSVVADHRAGDRTRETGRKLPGGRERTVGNIATNRGPRHDAAMANVEKLSVALTPEMVAEVRAAVEVGDYGSVSEVVRDALRLWRSRRAIETLETEELRQMVREGIESGPGLDAGAGFERLRARVRRTGE